MGKSGQSSINKAYEGRYQLDNASKFGSGILEASKLQKKLFADKCFKQDSDTSAREHDGKTGSRRSLSKLNKHSNEWVKVEDQKKRRRCCWDFDKEGSASQIDGGNRKQRKSRWDNNESQNSLINPSGVIDFLKLSMDPEIMRLNAKLTEINKKLQSSTIHDERPLAERSPSPEPVYNNLGMRINTRDARMRKKLLNEKQCIISKLALATSKSSPEPKPTKFVKKLFVPEREYPTYNFIGLILGPKGNTQKRMEKETGARINIRGKGSGVSVSETEDLHVLVEATSQQSLDAAVEMIEKLLIPVEDENNYHKKAQLAELARLKCTYKDDNVCDLCKEEGHKKYACPLQDSTFKAVCCDICGSFDHLTANCNTYMSAEICQTLQGFSGAELGSKDKSNNEVDPSNLYVCHLPATVDDKRLRDLFLPFGRIINTMVAVVRSTGMSKGFGFVKFENPLDAAAAITHMNGYKMEGRTLGVRVAEPKASLRSLHSGHVPSHSSQVAVPSNVFGQTSCIYEPLASMLPEAPISSLSNESLYPSSSFSWPNINVARTETQIAPTSLSDPWATSNSYSSYDFCDKVCSSLASFPDLLSQFPGNPDYPGSGFKPCFTSSLITENRSYVPEPGKKSSYRI